MKQDCEFHHPKNMCRKESNCTNKNCRFLHPQPRNKKRTNKEDTPEVLEVRQEASVPVKPVVPMPGSDIRNIQATPPENKGFQGAPPTQDSDQDVKKLLEELTKNVQILMQDRALMRSWGWLDTTQYYPQQS